MKNLFFIILMILSTQAFSQDSTKVVPARDTVINNVPYKLYTGSRGGKYILKISKTTGKEYKAYIKAKKP